MHVSALLINNSMYQSINHVSITLDDSIYTGLFVQVALPHLGSELFESLCFIAVWVSGDYENFKSLLVNNSNSRHQYIMMGSNSFNLHNFVNLFSIIIEDNNYYIKA